MKGKLFIAAAILGCASMMAQPASFSEPRMLIKGSSGLMNPVWSPDGTKLAVTGDNYVGIWVANADGTELTQLSQALGAGYQMAWSDASNITSTPYTMEGNRRMSRIENVNVETGAIKEIAAAERNLMRSKAFNAKSTLQIMIDEPMNATTLIASLNEYAGKWVLNPALSPDGSKIAFQIQGRGVFVCNADGTGLVSLGKGSHASWLPDNSNIMVTVIKDDGNRFTHSDIYCVNVETGKSKNITPNTDVIPVTMAVSPDGTKLAFDNDVDGCIYVIDLKY